VNIQIATVQRNGRAEDSRPRIQFCGDWLAEIGFVSGALAQTLPEPNGLAFNLRNENIGSYSDLFRSTREQGGALNRIYISNSKTRKGPTFVTTGRHIYNGGLKFGDPLIAMYEYGLIRVRKAAGNVKLIPVAREKHPLTGEPKPRVFLLGDWLSDIGFSTDTLTTVATEPGCITITAHAGPIVYSDIVRFARQNKMKLIQVSAKDGAPLIVAAGSCAEKAGFALGDIFCAAYEYGVIKLQKPDPEKFGF